MENKAFRKGILAISISAVMVAAYAAGMDNKFLRWVPLAPGQDKGGGDTTKYYVPKTGEKSRASMNLDVPSVLKKKVTLDSSMQNYKVVDQVGGVDVGDEKDVPFDQYQQDESKRAMQDYFRRRSQAQTNVAGKPGVLKLPTGDNELLNKALSKVEIRPQGSAELIFSEDFNRVQNPTWSLREQRNNQFKFDQKIQVSVIGTIGDKIKVAINYDTQAAFDFENQRKLSYEGKEDEIIKSIQVGDVSMPLSGSLISGSQSLFGVKTKLQFGKLDVTAVFSQQKSEKKEITLENGAQQNKFSITGDNYDANRHYFLSQYFRDHYNAYNRNWPALSNIQITRVEVWVTNTNITPTNTRAVLGFMDLGEESKTHNKRYVQTRNRSVPDNSSNSLYDKVNNGTGFRYVKTATDALNSIGNSIDSMYNTEDYYLLSNSKQLAATDFTVNARLGYISLNQALNPNDALAIAFEYTENGILHKVGEFSRDVQPDNTNPNVLILKLLKSPVLLPRLPMWNLMMKNIYSLGAYQIQPTDFRLQVLYINDRTGTKINYIPNEPTEPQLNGIPLISVLGLDKLNTQQEARPDGNFDYLEGVTINSQNGRVIFPVIEPFGADLQSHFLDQNVAKKYIFQELYDSTHSAAIQLAQKNKFYLEGTYQSASGTEISLNAINVPQGSVKVFAGGVQLVEGTDFVVDYNLGKVRIINQSVLNSGQVIKVQAESNTLFNIQQKTLMGTHMDYHVSKDFTIGSTLLYLKERPLTPKVNIGDEPIRNLVLGTDVHYKTNSNLITKLVDDLPFIQTKEKSSIAFDGEAARIYPGHPKLLNDPNDKGGVSYLDDFEGSIVPYDLRLVSTNWALASTPSGHPDQFPEAAKLNDLSYGFKRAKMSWYLIDNIFFNDNPLQPTNIKNSVAIQSNHYQRMVREQEVFPNEQIPNGTPGILQTLDLTYFPSQRGPYNYNTDLTSKGLLKNPYNNWAGIMRRIETSDFEANNIEYLEMWVMDPFIYKPASAGGELYINLGNISEDILKDGRKSYENGYPSSSTVTGVDVTAWGRVPNGIQINNAFSTEVGSRQYQDIGYDGLNDGDEQTFFADYLKAINSQGKVTDANVLAQINADPSNDNFKFYRATDYDNANADIIQRYLNYNNVQGNTPESATGNNGYGTQYPDDEDINHDLNLDQAEDYFEYKIKLSPNSMQIGQNYITDIQEASVTLADKSVAKVRWFQLKVPVANYTSKVGTISDFRSIRFMRMYMTHWTDSVTLRFARLQLIRGDWRKYNYSLLSPGEYLTGDTVDANLQVQAVNLQDNGTRPNIPYVLPPGINRTIDYSTPNLIQQNEQSLSLRLCGLRDGDARAVFKNTTFDLRLYKRMKMFVHAEGYGKSGLKDNQLAVFIRVGSDFNTNYYEYELPLKVTPDGSVDRNLIWPSDNNIDLPLSEFVNAKTARNALNWNASLPYTVPSNSTRGKITVVGNPNDGTVLTVMIGIRNPKDNGAAAPCSEIWVDELRVTDFDEQGGWAATGRLLIKAADFARLEFTGTRKTIGYGSIDQTVQQRSQSDQTGFGIVSSFELGKFFPQKLNVRIPMYYAYSEQINIPRYDPLSPDIELSQLKSTYGTNPAKYDSIVNLSEDYTMHKSLNFTGVQKMRATGSKKKPKIYDIENWNLTFIYNEIYKHNVTYVYDLQKTYSGQIAYGYTFTSKPFQPFSKIKNKNLKLISDFNFYYLPQSFNFSVRADRKYEERLFRNTDDYETVIQPQYDKNFTMARKYDFRYNLTKSLKFTYSASAIARIDEPYGKLDSKEKIDTVKSNFWKGGILNDFQHTTDLTYDVPISKFPYLDWTSLQASYKTSYEWKTGPPAAANLGNFIQNSAAKTLNGQLNFLNLYNKSKYLGNIAAGRSNRGILTQPKPKAQTEQQKAKDAKDAKKDIKNRYKKKKKGSSAKSTPNPDDNKSSNTGQGLSPTETLIGLLMSVRSATFNYSVTDGQALPGFRSTPTAIGQDFNGNASAGIPAGGPGLPFVFGIQDPNYRFKAAQRGWLVGDTNLSSQYLSTHRESLTGQVLLEPIKNMRITMDFSRVTSSSYSETFRYVQGEGFTSLSPVEMGSYSISWLLLNTSFIGDRADNSNAAFESFQNKRLGVAQQLANANPFARGAGVDPSTGYPLGYGRYSQDVLIPAFLSAYSGRSVTSTFPQIPAPNWRLTYSGLSNIKALKKVIKSINVSHAYKSTYSVDGYRSASDYDPTKIPDTGNLNSKYNIDRVTLTESFAPLIGFDVSWVNNWTSRIEYRKDRTLSLSFVDRRLSETRGDEITIGAGYRTNKLKIPFSKSGSYLKNDFTFRLDVSYRDNKQEIRILDDPTTVPSGGQRLFSLTPNVTYVLDKNLTLNVFFKRTSNHPYTSNQYPTAFTSIGFSLRYVLTP